MQKGLTLSQILSAEDCKPTPVECPEWGGTVYVLPLTGTQRDQWDQIGVNAQKGGSLAGMRSKLIAWTMCDEHGKRMDVSSKDILKLGEKSGAVVERVAGLVLEISGLREPEKNLAESDSSGSS